MPTSGVVVLVRIIDGTLKKGQKILMMGTDAHYDVDRLGVFTPKMKDARRARARARWASSPAQIKQVADTRVGDTITDERKHCDAAPARLPSRRSRWCSAACSRSTRPSSTICAPAMGRLRLNDASFSFEMESSAALGFGFRCGFLGLLHLEIIQERLEREFNLDLIATAPSVVYEMKLRDGPAGHPAQPRRHARPDADPRNPGAVDPRHHPDPRRLPRLGPKTVPGAARRAGRPQLRRLARDGGVRPAAERGGFRFSTTA